MELLSTLIPQPQKASPVDPELGTAQPQLVFYVTALSFVEINVNQSDTNYYTQNSKSIKPIYS